MNLNVLNLPYRFVAEFLLSLEGSLYYYLYALPV